MELLPNLPDALLYFLPGFVGVKVFYTFGLKTARTDFEWGIWSVLASVLLFMVTAPIRTALALADNSAISRFGLVVLAALLGVLAAWLWNAVLAPRWRWRFTPEPWDMIYFTAVAKNLQAVVELNDGREAQGDIVWMGLASEGSTRSITLANVQMSGDNGGWVSLAPGEELHIPEDAMRVLRLVKFEPKPT